ncbi:putative secreted protein (Por secretion system target) [Thermoflavifilum aggregans]|uniref:Putative secreted protein (Por secretion system target) n=1 Tax=Thermoflavifilum aggregans TaxID=454188 RepID=A0A2M9CX47_9BACT|nr:T9SS type A sorting domain-containing protein [Thermoflavifilum aggregans]PJJ76494.1 putative secreted protein (Por secretion system target) [Thermoflavifilum aggregans]
MLKCLPLIFLLAAFAASAQTVDVFTAVQNGGWNTASTWSPSGPPQPLGSGHKVKVVIPAGITVNTLDITSPPQEMTKQIDTIVIFGSLQLGDPNANPTTDFFFDYPVYILIANGGRLVDSTSASSSYGGPGSTPRHVIALQKGNSPDTSAIVIQPGGEIQPACDAYPGTYIYGVSGNHSSSNYTYYAVPYTISCPGPFPSDNSYSYIISVDYNTGAVNYSGPITLPVILINFSGYYQQGMGVQLQWSTSSEYNSSYFAVERSTDGTSFTELGRVQAQGNSQIAHSYTFTDGTVLKSTVSLYYYRLRQVDLDGHFTYSKVIAIHIPLSDQSPGNLLLWPNPNTGNFQLQIPLGENQKAMLRIVNLAGQVVQQQWVNSPISTIRLQQPTSGVYLVQIQYADGSRKTLRMLVIQ